MGEPNPLRKGRPRKKATATEAVPPPPVAQAPPPVAAGQAPLYHKQKEPLQNLVLPGWALCLRSRIKIYDFVMRLFQFY